MNQQVATIENQAIAAWTPEQVNLIKHMVIRGPREATNEELHLFGMICQQSGLNPFNKQIYAIIRGNDMTIQTGIDGLRLIADRTGLYVGSDEPRFGPDVKGHPEWAAMTVYKWKFDQRMAFTSVVRWSELAGSTDFWQKMPYHMLAKVAESQALRKAFPAETSGIYTTEEMDQADNTRTTVESAPKPAPQSHSRAPLLQPQRNNVESSTEATMAVMKQLSDAGKPVGITGQTFHAYMDNKQIERTESGYTQMLNMFKNNIPFALGLWEVARKLPIGVTTRYANEHHTPLVDVWQAINANPDDMLIDIENFAKESVVQA